MSKTIRCAIYTRKSTEHNLDLEFNSLHAQREACEAYIKSQMHEGWQLVPDHYDDGAFSGASLDRPDLQRLIGDIAGGTVDNVVVYKVDRLTRSLTDFARLVELFDQHKVSFVSVTQAFNTTTSMGRLTLNVLLSFAQFEREVIGERVRDKIAASKKKGLFMGGNIPLGYANRDKKLIIVPEEAERVRWLFRRYLELKSIGRLLEDMNRQNIRTKVLTLSNGKKRGGGPFGKGALAYLLKNRCYVGEILHKGQVHAADHVAIIDRTTFEAVQASLAANTIIRRTTAQASSFLLTGLLFDSAGNRMTPSHSRKKGVRYRYYISQAVLQSRKAHAGQVSRIPAPDIEAQIERFIRDRCRGPQGDLRALIEAQIIRIEVEADSISIELASPLGVSADEPALSRQTVSLPWSKKPFRAEKGVAALPSPIIAQSHGDPRAKEAVLMAIAKARRWVGELVAGGVLAEIAKQEGRSERHIRMLIPLAFLSPADLDRLVHGTVLSSVVELARDVRLTWTPRENLMRPARPWPEVAEAISRTTGVTWTVERLMRSVLRLVGEGMVDRKVLAKAPRPLRRRNEELAVLVRGTALANPGMSLRGIGGQLEAMKIRTPAGKSNWTAPSVAHLLSKKPPMPSLNESRLWCAHKVEQGDS